METPRTATLMGLDGRGYAVVESLPSLGKGRSCTGIFVTCGSHAEALETACRERRRVPFRGPTHFRHVSAETSLEVEITRVDPAAEPGGDVTVEFTARNVPYDLSV